MLKIVSFWSTENKDERWDDLKCRWTLHLNMARMPYQILHTTQMYALHSLSFHNRTFVYRTGNNNNKRPLQILFKMIGKLHNRRDWMRLPVPVPVGIIAILSDDSIAT